MAESTINAVCMENLVFLHDMCSLTLREYYRKYKNFFPDFIIVTQGYFGGSDLEVLGKEQVLRINSCVIQQRAVAKDSQNRILAIPTNYQLQFRVIDKKGKEKDYLKNIILKHGTPVKVEISDPRKFSFTLNNSQQNIQTLGQLNITSVYEETYLLANAICDGKVQLNATLVPLYLSDVKVAQLVGIKGHSQQVWRDFQVYVHNLCGKVPIPLDTGLLEIAMFSSDSIDKDSSEHIYEQLQPSNHIVADWEGRDRGIQSKTVTEMSFRPPAPLPPRPTAQSKHDDIPPKLPVRRAMTKNDDAPSHTISGKHTYTNDIGRAVVEPFTYLHGNKIPAKKPADRGQGQEQSEGQAARQQNEKKPIRMLSIGELGEKLKSLKLGQYVRVFEEQGVDGELALDLTTSILREDFKFSRFEAVKFLKFVETGHIPN